jgi:predicted RNA-binding protein
VQFLVGHRGHTVTRLFLVAKTWVLTGSLENFRATREHGFRVIGAKEGRRGMAEQIEPGDRIVFYVTGVQAFGGIVRVTGEMYEDRTKIWPGKPGKVDPYPWRFETEPEVVLDEDEFVPAVELASELEHVGKWPAEHWHLAFQGQLRTVPDADARLLEQRIRAGARAAA